jgi:hypothetical protein
MLDGDELKLNGLAIKSWGDVVAVVSMLSIFLGVVAWGLKLEARNDGLADRVAALEARVSDGILPRAEERINQHDREFVEFQRRLERLENRD